MNNPKHISEIISEWLTEKGSEQKTPAKEKSKKRKSL